MLMLFVKDVYGQYSDPFKEVAQDSQAARPTIATGVPSVHLSASLLDDLASKPMFGFRAQDRDDRANGRGDKDTTTISRGVTQAAAGIKPVTGPARGKLDRHQFLRIFGSA